MSTLKTNKSRLSNAGTLLHGIASWRSGKDTAGQRGYNYEWQRYRAQYLVEHPVCVMRGEGCTLAASVVDHITPHRGNAALFHDHTNHQALCIHCHSAHKQRLEALGL